MILFPGSVEPTETQSKLKNTIQVEEIENKKVPTAIKTLRGGREQNIVTLSHNTEAKVQDAGLSSESSQAWTELFLKFLINSNDSINSCAELQALPSSVHQLDPNI